MSGFFKKLFNRVTGREAADEAAPTPAAAPEPLPAAVEPEPGPEPEPTPPPPTPPPPVVVEKAKPKAKARPIAKAKPVSEAEARPAPKPALKPLPAPEPEPEPEPEIEPVPPPVAESAPAPLLEVPVEILAEPLPAARPGIEEDRVPPPPPPTPAPEPAPRGGWITRLRHGLSKSTRSLTGGITDIFTKKKLDAATLEELEDLLIQGDLGVDMAARITAAVAKGRYDREIDPGEVRRILAAEVEKALKPVEVPFTFDETQKPFVVLVVGVNGTGKTTTIGKLGAIAVDEGFSVLLAACDTFRAAAIEQLAVWGERIGAKVVSRPTGADAAGLAFDALAEARRAGTDIVFIDTAGRLHNKADLMSELEKIVRVVKKQDESAPHAVLLVLDATTGQNAIAQADVFTRIAGVTGIVMTKLDGTARGGILVAIAERFKLPVHAIGVGETLADLQPFDAAAFARAIAGLDADIAP